MKFTIDEYSKQFKMSKEMIKSKLRNKRINYIIENGMTYIIATQPHKQEIKQEAEQADVQTKKEILPAKQKTTVATILALYQRENNQLKEKIVQLEEKIDKLIDDKEQMLRDELNKIETLYSSKDEQLKNILELINAKLTLEREPQLVHDVDSISISEKATDNEKVIQKIVELKEYLKTLNLKSYQRKIIKKRFLAVYDSDIRIIHQNGNLFLDFSKYDYSDLLEY